MSIYFIDPTESREIATLPLPWRVAHLADAMRHGCRISEPLTTEYMRVYTRDGIMYWKACIVGAAALGTFGFPTLDSTLRIPTSHRMAAVRAYYNLSCNRVIVTLPVKKAAVPDTTRDHLLTHPDSWRGDLLNILLDLNDSLGWQRDDIVIWLESIAHRVTENFQYAD